MGIKRKRNEDGTCELKQGMSIIQSVVYPAGSEPQRIHSSLQQLFPARYPTNTAAKRAIRRKLVILDQKQCKIDDIVHPGQTIQLLERVVPGGQLNPALCPIKIQVVYEDDNIACVIKPPGIKTNGTGNISPPTLSTCLKFLLKPGKGEGVLYRPREAHRLDLVTGGLVLAAKSSKALELTASGFANRQIKKKYRAIVHGEIEMLSGTIDKQLDDKESVTKYEVVEIMVNKENNLQRLTVVDLWPQTGRYHQLRRHLASTGHPIYGDPLFKESGERRNNKRQKLNSNQEDQSEHNGHSSSKKNDLDKKKNANGESSQADHDQDSSNDPIDEEQFWSDASIDEELKKSIKNKTRNQEGNVVEDVNLGECRGSKEIPEVRISLKREQIQESAFKGQVMLWASSLDFVHPIDGRKFFIEVEEPQYFKQLLETFEQVKKD